MKKYFLFLLLISIVLETEASNVKVFIKKTMVDDTGGTRAAAIMQAVDMFFVARMKKEYPCMEYLDSEGLAALLDLERQHQLLGTGDENALQNMASALGCKYLVSINVKVVQDQSLITLIFMDNTKAKTLSRSFQTAQYGDPSIDAAEKAANDLFEGLKQYEICPFKGEISVKVVSSLKDEDKENYNVYCNGLDATYNKVTTINNYSENNWTINKKSINGSTGNVTISLSEEAKIEEENWCYECAPNKFSPRTYTETVTSYADITGLSQESEAEGIAVDDARVYLTFLDNGTYTIRVTAASTQGQKKTTIEISAKGSCDNINDGPQKVINNIDAGLNEMWGPFTGTAQDKVLSQTDTITNTLDSGEEQTITYEFNLTRE